MTPVTPPGTTGMATSLLAVAAFDESLAEICRAHQLDPFVSGDSECRTDGCRTSCTGAVMRQLQRKSAWRSALDPNYAQAHFRLGLVQIQQRRYPEAIASLQRSIDLGVHA